MSFLWFSSSPETNWDLFHGQLPAPGSGQDGGMDRMDRGTDTAWTPQQHAQSRQHSWEGVVGSLLALKKGKWSKSTELRGVQAVLALAEGVLRAPPAVDGFLKCFIVPNPLVVSQGSCSQHRIPVPSQLQSPGAGSSSGLAPPGLQQHQSSRFH